MAKPISEWTTEDLQALLGSEETSNLEFKDGRSLLNEIPKKNEIAKDVSAMANAAGGLIIYGIHERDSVADSIAGCPAEHAKAEWFEQVINNNIEPKVQGVTIKRIDLPDDKLALVVDVPKATTFAPHQSKPHHAYFRRYNTTTQPMLDHEVRDLMRRGSSPELYLRYAFWGGFDPDLYRLKISFGNHAPEPALYSRVDILFENALAPIDPVANWNSPNNVMMRGVRGPAAGKIYSRTFRVPHDMPIMTESEDVIFDGSVVISNNMVYTMAHTISAPGFRTHTEFEVYRMGDKRIITDPPQDRLD